MLKLIQSLELLFMAQNFLSIRSLLWSKSPHRCLLFYQLPFTCLGSSSVGKENWGERNDFNVAPPLVLWHPCLLSQAGCSKWTFSRSAGNGFHGDSTSGNLPAIILVIQFFYYCPSLSSFPHLQAHCAQGEVLL